MLNHYNQNIKIIPETDCPRTIVQVVEPFCVGVNFYMQPVIYKENYLVYPDGDVFNIKRKKFQKHNIDKGYVKVCINCKQERLHRILATCFINNPENKPYINHKDGNKSNNDIFNLEWCTQAENNKHAWDFGLKKYSEKSRQISFLKNKKVIDLRTMIIYSCTLEVCIIFGYNKRTLQCQLGGHDKNHTPFRYV